jgi:hypothetical protein
MRSFKEAVSMRPAMNDNVTPVRKLPAARTIRPCRRRNWDKGEAVIGGISIFVRLWIGAEPGQAPIHCEEIIAL